MADSAVQPLIGIIGLRPGRIATSYSDHKNPQRSRDRNVVLTGLLSGICVVTGKESISVCGDRQTRPFAGTKPIRERLGEIGFLRGGFDAGQRLPHSLGNLIFSHTPFALRHDSGRCTHPLERALQDEIRPVDSGKVHQNRVVQKHRSCHESPVSTQSRAVSASRRASSTLDGAGRWGRPRRSRRVRSSIAEQSRSSAARLRLMPPLRWCSMV